jgi:hypothetical protein
MSNINEDVRKRGGKWCAYVDDKITKAEKEGNPKKYKGKKVGSVQKTPSGNIRMKARACYASKKKANNAMAAAMMEGTEGLRMLIRELMELQAGIEGISMLAPHLAGFLDGLISAGDTKERVLAMLLKFKGYRDQIPAPIHRAMEIVVPGFRSFEHFEDMVMSMSEDELDRRLARLLSLIQTGRLAGMST